MNSVQSTGTTVRKKDTLSEASIYMFRTTVKITFVLPFYNMQNE